MTNTLNTPIEALEADLPLRVTAYQLRDGSGGAGRHPGGAGIRRSYAILAPMTVTLNTERRATAPYGLAGGEPGAPGANTLIRDGHAIALGAKATFAARPGDHLVIDTPGGGGWGAASDARDSEGDQR